MAFFLPAALDSDNPKQQHSAPGGSATLVMVNPLRILVVEDNPVNQKLLSLMLQPFGYTSVVAENGRIGYERYLAGEFDLILMDIQMPVMDGFEATAAIRAREDEAGGGHIPIIAVTAHVMPGYREQCLARGMDNYIPKPFKMQELKEIITNTLQQRNVAR